MIFNLLNQRIYYMIKAKQGVFIICLILSFGTCMLAQNQEKLKEEMSVIQVIVPVRVFSGSG